MVHLIPTTHFWLCLLAISCKAAVYNSVEELPSVEYDFVIVGGGTAGNVVANRLSENPKFSVLVLESGPSNEGVFDSVVPWFLFRPDLTTGKYSWNYTTTPQKGLNGRSFPYPRGHILGGCSSINWMYYTRGSAEDFDRWARLTGDPGWSWNGLQKYIRRNERWTAPVDGHNTRGQFDPSVHGFSGVNAVSLAGFPQSIDDRVIQTTKELPDDFPYNQDTNSGNPLGLGWLQATINHGRRSSSATSYLGPQFINRQNLHVVLNTRVTKLLSTGIPDGQPSFRTVEIAQNRTGPIRHITVQKEVILSAGVMGTPHILLNSGIGDERELRAVGIKPLVHLPSVGKNLSDQPGMFNSWFVNSTDTTDTFMRNATRLDELLALWNRTGGGPLSDTAATQIAWTRLPRNSKLLQDFADPAAGPNTPHLEFFPLNGLPFAVLPAGNFFSMATIVASPLSRGSLTINSSSPFDPPVIDVGLLNSEYDFQAMRVAVQTAKRFTSAPAWKGYILEPFGSFANTSTDAQLDAYIRQSVGSVCHAVGTAAMSSTEARFGVVNPDLTVKGVRGVRVIDASIMPFIPSGHTQAPTYILAERGADLVKAGWR